MAVAVIVRYIIAAVHVVLKIPCNDNAWETAAVLFKDRSCDLNGGNHVHVKFLDYRRFAIRDILQILFASSVQKLDENI